MDFGYTPTPAPDEQPAFMVTPKRPLQSLYVQVDAGGERYTFDRSDVAAEQTVRFEWARVESVTSASVYVRGTFIDGYVEEVEIPVEYSYGGQLSVDLSSASADLRARTLTVSVNHPVDRAGVVAYGAHRAELERGEVVLNAGPGELQIPWRGDPSEVVLLEVTLHSGQTWAGFTFSPWVLNIPHDDIHFPTNEASIPEVEAWKLEATLQRLHDVLDKYGSVVPVKVYIAGCTDTVGDNASNRALSERRARAIAEWLRQHGYSQPLYFYGFGEDLLAVKTGDGVDNASNRRALYIVSASPPPPSSGIPSVGWKEL